MSEQPEQNPYAPPQDPAELAQRPDDHAVRRQIKEMNDASFAFGVPGFLLQSVGRGVGGSVGNAISLFGAVLFILGLSYFARSRGYHWALGFLGLLSCLGLLILALLPKKCVVCRSESVDGRCQKCGAPVAA